MRAINGYLLASIALVLVSFSAGANLRFKRSESGTDDLDLDSNGFCKTAKTWTLDCNTCFCAAGGAPGCTLRGCHYALAPEIVSIKIEPEREIKKVDGRVKRSDSEPTTVVDKCVSGATWKEDCNTCWCSDNGIKLCTKIGCVHLSDIQRTNV